MSQFYLGLGVAWGRALGLLGLSLRSELGYLALGFLQQRLGSNQFPLILRFLDSRLLFQLDVLLLRGT